jgi:hypothetical protein
MNISPDSSKRFPFSRVGNRFWPPSTVNQDSHSISCLPFASSLSKVVGQQTVDTTEQDRVEVHLLILCFSIVL